MSHLSPEDLDWIYQNFTVTTHPFKTDAITSLFGIPSDMHLVIASLVLTATGAAQFEFTWDFQTTEPPAGVESKRKIRMEFPAASNPIIVPVNIHIRDVLEFIVSGNAVRTAIGFYFSKGGMRWLDDVGDTMGQITQIKEPERSAGGQYYQVGDYRKKVQ